MAATNHGAIIGQYSGATVAAAFTNPQHLDLIQIIHPLYGSVVANVDYLGVAHNPAASATGRALIGQYVGTSYATAFKNPGNDDLIQVIQPNDGSIVYYLDYLGANH